MLKIILSVWLLAVIGLNLISCIICIVAEMYGVAAFNAASVVAIMKMMSD